MAPEGQRPLGGRVALITGASRGIGRAIALAMAEAGANLVLSARGMADLEKVAEEVRGRGVEVAAIPCDVSDAAQVEALAREAEAGFGRVDILVNNAGIAESHKFLGHPDDLWHRALDVNLTGTYLVCKAFVPGMVARRWGRVINIASVAAKTGAKYIAAYTASKHGVLGLTRALAAELAEHGVTVNAICPGYVDTPMTEAAIRNIVARTGRSPEEARRVLEQTSPQGRLIQPEEVALVAVTLAREEAAGINGQAINVDGGAVMA